MRQFFLYLVCLIICVHGDQELPSFVEQCYRDDPAINECFKRNVENLRPRLAKGIPKLQIPPFRPLKIPEVTLKADKSFKIDLYNAKVYDTDKCIIVTVNLDLKKMKFNLKLNCENMGLVSDYKMKGKLMILLLDTTGQVHGNFTGIIVNIALDLSLKTKNGKEHMAIDKSDWKLTIRKYFMVFDNLFGDNKQLNTAANKILNDNYEILSEEFIPIVRNIMKSVFDGIYGNLILKYPYDVLFPKKVVKD